MCMTLFAAADAPLPERPEAMPPNPLSVRRINADEEPVRAQFTKPHVYFVGSHTGCSCGFQYGPNVDQDREGRESVAQLGAYLVEIVRTIGPVELYACWNGDATNAEDVRESITPARFSRHLDEFDLPERWFANVVDQLDPDTRQGESIA